MKFDVTISRNNPLVYRDTYEFQVHIRPVALRENSFCDVDTAFVCVFSKQLYIMRYDPTQFREFAKDAEAVTDCDCGFITCHNFVMEQEDYEYFKGELSDIEGCIYDTSWDSINKAFHRMTERLVEPDLDESTSEFLLKIYEWYAYDAFHMADTVDFEVD